MSTIYYKATRERFWSKVPERPDEGCWEWAGAKRGEQSSLAREFGVTQALIWQIVNRKAWAHV